MLNHIPSSVYSLRMHRTIRKYVHSRALGCTSDASRVLMVCSHSVTMRVMSSCAHTHMQQIHIAIQCTACGPAQCHELTARPWAPTKPDPASIRENRPARWGCRGSAPPPASVTRRFETRRMQRTYERACEPTNTRAVKCENRPARPTKCRRLDLAWPPPHGLRRTHVIAHTHMY